MAIPTLLLSPAESRDRNGPVKPTVSSSVRVVDGEHGPAWQVAEATENLIPNPVPNTHTGWWSGGVAGTSSQAPRPWDSTKMCRKRVSSEDTTLGLGPIQSGEIPVVPGAQYTFSMTMMTEGDSGNVTLVLQGKEAAGGPTLTIPLEGLVTWNTRYLETNVPTRLSVTFTIPSPFNFLSTLGFFARPSVAGQALYAADAQLEEKAYATPYADGDMGDGFSWAGAPHASSSVRAAGTVLTTVWGPKADGGSYILRYSRHSSARSDPYIISTGSTPTLFVGAHNFDTSTSPVTFANGDSFISRFSPASFPPAVIGDHVRLAFSWDRDTMKFFAPNGQVGVADISDIDLVDGGPLITLGYFAISYGNVSIESGVFYDTPLSEEEITRLMNMPEAWTWENLMPQIGGVRTTHSPAPFAVRSEHNPASFAARSTHEEV